MALIDTNHCSMIMSGHPEVTARMSEDTGRRLTINAIVRGELVFMACKSDRVEHNRLLLESFLRSMEILPLDAETADLYGELKAACIAHYGPREKKEQRRIRIEQLGISDNDLWIVATALRHGLTVVSSDGDMERIREVRDFPLERWDSPPGAKNAEEGE